MKAVLQRVRRARVVVAGKSVGEIGAGLLLLVCAEQGDTEATADRLLAKILKLRIFSDARGKMNHSVQDMDGTGRPGGLLVVSQFTLAADISGGNRPSFTGAASPPRRILGAGSTITLWRGRGRRTSKCKPGSLPPTCRCTWSTTGR